MTKLCDVPARMFQCVTLRVVNVSDKLTDFPPVALRLVSDNNLEVTDYSAASPVGIVLASNAATRGRTFTGKARCWQPCAPRLDSCRIHQRENSAESLAEPFCNAKAFSHGPRGYRSDTSFSLTMMHGLGKLDLPKCRHPF